MEEQLISSGIESQISSSISESIGAFLTYVNLPFTGAVFFITIVFNMYTDHEKKAQKMNVFRRIPIMARLILLSVIVALVFIFLLDFKSQEELAGMFFGTFVALAGIKLKDKITGK